MQKDRHKMAEQRVAPYEGMFLLTQAATADLNAAVDHIRAIIAKAGAEIIAMSKWDERRFAFEIKKQKRGVYILVYFNSPTKGLPVIERECNLSDTVLRVMVVRADHLSEEEMRATDAQRELADEAALRRERAAEADAEASVTRAEPEAAGVEQD